MTADPRRALIAGRIGPFLPACKESSNRGIKRAGNRGQQEAPGTEIKEIGPCDPPGSHERERDQCHRDDSEASPDRPGHTLRAWVAFPPHSALDEPKAHGQRADEERSRERSGRRE